MNKQIVSILARLYKGKITNYEAEIEMARISQKDLAEFIVDAKNRGWITNFNLGLNEEGNVM